MANDVINTQTITTGPLTALDAENLPGAGPAGQDIFRERVQITGSALAEVTRVLNAAPAVGDYGAVTRNIPRTTTAGTPAGFTVSTVAVLLAASNVNRRAIIITNSGSKNVFIGHTAGVTNSGAALGLLLAPNGTYQDSGDGLYTGDLYGIASAVVASQNISVSERT